MIRKDTYIIRHVDGSIVSEVASCASEAKKKACLRRDFDENSIASCEVYYRREERPIISKNAAAHIRAALEKFGGAG